MSGTDPEDSPSPPRIIWSLLAALARVAAFAILSALGAVCGLLLTRRFPVDLFPWWLALHIGCCALVFLAWPTVRQALAIFRAPERGQWLTLTSAAIVALTLLSYVVFTGILVLVRCWGI